MIKRIKLLSVLLLIFLNCCAFIKLSSATTDAISDIPDILPRSTWENDASLKKLLTWYPSEENSQENTPPEYFNIERIIVHDMGCVSGNAGCNNKRIGAIELIQGIYRYHAVTKNWGDIGYHYIIDYDGNIYEGRYGGNGVRGAHAYYNKKCDNFNVGTVGILLMGNYEKTKLPEVMQKSLVKLIAWISYTNGLDPGEMSHYSEIWHAPKNGKECDISKGGLTASYSGPIVLGHKDIEEGNSDPGLVDLVTIRKEAKTMLSGYKNYAFKAKENTQIYSIKNGQLEEIQTNVANFELITLAKSQLDAFKNQSVNKLSDDVLVKSDTRDTVYLMKENKRRPILSQQLFKLKSYKWENVISLPDRNLAVYALGEPITYPEKSLIKGSGPEVYFIENEKRRHVTSAQLFNNKGFKWNKVLQVNEEELLAHQLGEPLLFDDGTLIRGSGPEIYLIKNQKKHWIKTASIFSGLGFKWKDVIKLSAQELNQYALGDVISVIGDVAKLNEEQKQETKEEFTAKEISIRVGITSLAEGSILKITANGSYEIYINDKFDSLKNKDEIFTSEITNDKTLKFVPKTDNTIFQIISYIDRPGWNQNLNDNLFRGSIEVKYSAKSNKIWIINELGIESYIKGVAEALDSDSMEYLKTLIVSARSYALFHVQNGGKYPQEIFHLNNTSSDQVYRGYGFELRAKNITKAAEDTRGVVIHYNNKVARGVYSSDSGGTTKDSCKIWGGVFCSADYDYLRGGIKDPTGTQHSDSAILASHGVGVSATGARKLALQGKTYEEILKYYYPGVEVKKIY